MLRRMSLAIWLIANGLLVGCGGTTLWGPSVYDIDVDPRTLPPEGGVVRIEIHTDGARQVTAVIKRPDGTEFETLLQPISVLTYGEKWKREIQLPPNTDPKGDDQVYTIVLRIWGEDSGLFNFYREKSAGKVIVKGTKTNDGNSDSSNGSTPPEGSPGSDGKSQGQSGRDA